MEIVHKLAWTILIFYNEIGPPDILVNPSFVSQLFLTEKHLCMIDHAFTILMFYLSSTLQPPPPPPLHAHLLYCHPAEDCQDDTTESWLVPIAVGVALTLLVLIVLVAYFIGRKRNQGTGYEHF